MGPKEAGELVKASKTKPWDVSWHKSFLVVLAEEGVVRRACNAAGVAIQTAYRHREQFPQFAEAWDEACEEAVETLELAARRRALAESDTLLIFLLKANKPEKYRDTYRHEVSGPNGAAVPVEITDARAKLAELIARRNEAQE